VGSKLTVLTIKCHTTKSYISDNRDYNAKMRKYVDVLKKHRAPFFSIFPGAAIEFPAIVLRIGKTDIAL
jgi:hypothetical protein